MAKVEAVRGPRCARQHVHNLRGAEKNAVMRLGLHNALRVHEGAVDRGADRRLADME
ncbi:hypothetical protein [Nitratidesulfovibrio sp. SRB-5]|uniref:hypothetical protein n=1 Tax=Nitratidesulfovibrio sp. SRB-5 TaxID=2872636 RepID=UPI00167D89CD|nr:hypothetical protein [Nitratidesulfovibrio sp. SRB-5]MBZ2173008.1 hypothetical protein [Nitratidesulfovibrio sp. SRB-5]